MREKRKNDPIFIPAEPQSHGESVALGPAGFRDSGRGGAAVHRPSRTAADGRAAGADAVLRLSDNPFGGQHGAGFSDSCGAVFYFDAAIL